jgi:hypothetical protein
MSETFNLANQQFKTSKFEDAIINYKSVLENSKSNDEKYISCLRIHESFYKVNKEQDGIYYLIESFKYDEKRIECIYKLIVYYNIKGSPNISLSFYSLIQDYFENKFISDYENILKKLDVKIDEYIFYLPYFMIIISHKLNKPEIAIKMFEIIFKYKYIDSGEWWLNNLFHNFNLFINKIGNENLFKEFEVYLNLIYINKRYNLNLEKINTICNYGINYGLNYKNIKYLNNNKLKILFHMSDNRPIKKNLNINDASYNGLAAVINYEYCKKYGYDFKYYVPFLDQLEPLNLHNCLDPNNNQPRHASWSKLLASQKALDSEENYDYIVYLDSDCIVKNFDIPLESIIYGYENKSMIFFWDQPCTPNEPNAGVYICKNNLNTKLMIEEWYNVNVPHQNINRIWEQTALWMTYKKWQKLGKDNLEILENINLIEKENQYLRHIHTGDSKSRIGYFNNIIERKKINYTKNLENIIEIQFDTNLLYSKKIKKSRMYIFIPYYGSFPNYFQLYLDSLSINNDILTVFIITDIDTSSYKIPENAIIINMKLQEIRERVALFLKNEYSMNINPDELLKFNYKLCEYKIIYPILFDDLIIKYNISKNDYVGWGDCDLIYGKLSNMINLLENNYDIIGGANGHFTVVLNNTMKYLYKKIPEYNNMCIDKGYKFSDEHGGLHKVLNDNNFNIFLMKYSMNDILPDCMFHTLRPDHNKNPKFLDLGNPLIDIEYLYFDKQNEKLITVYIDGIEKENTYCHLQKRKMEIKFDKYDNIFYINQYSFSLTMLHNQNNQEECNKSNKILIYTGFCDKKWNYSYSQNSALGGSERAVINIAKYLQKDYNIYIGGDVEEEIYENIRFIKEENLGNLLRENYFTTIIISRFINFFELYPFFKTKNLFIWGHDVNLLTRSANPQKALNILNKWNSKINNYICLTEWQKQRYENTYPMIKGKIILINNGINLDLFSKNINKKKNRFVFTSGPARGLGRVLELWPEICNKLENAELKFATYTNFPCTEEDNKMQEIISKYNNIHFMGKLNPIELYELQASSDYWLYPTNFDETSCITALEMLYNEVICVYYPRAGLTDTVGEFGIKVSEGNEINSIINLTEEDKIRIRASGKKYAEECSWENRANTWFNLIR